jgi:hypothetical protein
MQRTKGGRTRERMPRRGRKGRRPAQRRNLHFGFATVKTTGQEIRTETHEEGFLENQRTEKEKRTESKKKGKKTRTRRDV